LSFFFPLWDRGVRGGLPDENGFSLFPPPFSPCPFFFSPFAFPRLTKRTRQLGNDGYAVLVLCLPSRSFLFPFPGRRPGGLPMDHSALKKPCVRRFPLFFFFSPGFFFFFFLFSS